MKLIGALSSLLTKRPISHSHIKLRVQFQYGEVGSACRF